MTIKYLLVEEVAVDIKQRQNAGFVELLFISILVFDLVDGRLIVFDLNALDAALECPVARKRLGEHGIQNQGEENGAIDVFCSINRSIYVYTAENPPP